MSNQYLKLRRSAVPGKVPDTGSLDFGELALNTADGKLFMKKTGSMGEQIIAFEAAGGSYTGSFSGDFNGQFTGSFDGTFTGSFDGVVTGEFSGSLANLSGSENYIPVFSSTDTLVDSNIYKSGSSVILNQTNATAADPEALYVWQPHPTSINVISGKGNLNNYLQLNIHNLNAGTSASSDIVATANNGTEFEKFIDMGINGENYIDNGNGVGNANDAYLYAKGNDLWIGNHTPGKYVRIFNGDPIHQVILITPTNEINVSASLYVSGPITGRLIGTASWAENALTASYVDAANVVGLNLSRISTGSVSASVGINDFAFKVNSGSYDMFYVSSSGTVGINTTGSGMHRLEVSGSTMIAGNLHVNGYISASLGDNNVVIGLNTGKSITTSRHNVVIGTEALQSISNQGNGSIAIGYQALSASISGRNTAIGYQALTRHQVTPGVIGNVSVGIWSMEFSTYGSANVSLGHGAGQWVTGSNNISLGYGSGGTGVGTLNNSIVLGHLTQRYAGTLNNVIVIGGGLTVTKDNVAVFGRADQNIGIGGQIDPQYKLDVLGSGNFSGGLTVTGSVKLPSLTGVNQNNVVGVNPSTGELYYQSTSSLSVTNAVNAINSINAINAETASYAPNYLPLTGGVINGNVTVNGTASISFLYVEYQTSSVIYSSGSNQFGDDINDVQSLYGTVLVSGSQQVTGSLSVSQGITGSLYGTSSWATNAISSSYPLDITGSTIYTPVDIIEPSADTSILVGPGVGSYTSQSYNIVALGSYSAYEAYNAHYGTFIGTGTGGGARNAQHSIMFGYNSGLSAVDAFDSIFMGQYSGYQAATASQAVYLGAYSGYQANNAYDGIFLGYAAGYQSTNAHESIFLGGGAGGNANEARRSIMIGQVVGTYAVSASNSIIIGNWSGRGSGYGESIGTNNIIIGSNISLDYNRRDSINIGGILFGTGSYFNWGGDVFSGSANGKIGINQPYPDYTLDVSGSARFYGAIVTGSFNVSGSSTQIGNNTLLGNTVLSGSLIISGAYSTSNPTVRIYGDTQHNGYIRFDPVTTNIDTSISASYIYVSGSTNDLYFSQNGNGYTNVTRLRWLEGNLYTGLLNGGRITTQSATTYEVASGSGIIVNLNASLNDNPYPTINYVNWSTLSASISPLSASYDQSFVAIDATGSIYVQGVPYDDGQFNTLIPIGNVIHQNRSTINGTATYPSLAYGWKQRSSDFIRAFGPLKLSGFNIITTGSVGSGILVGSGTAWSDGRNYTVDPNSPSYISDPGVSTLKIYRYRQSGSGWVYDTNGGAGYTTLDHGYYNNPNTGVLTTLNASEWTIQRIYIFPGGATKATYAYYGNAIYTSEAEARTNIEFEEFNEAPNTKAGAIYVGVIIFKGNFTDWSQTDRYSIYPAGLFRNVGGSGGGGTVATTRLVDLSDVNVVSPTDKQALVYDITSLKWINSSTINASITGNAATATTASYAINATSASYSDNTISASYALQSTSASFAQNSVSSSYALTASYALNAGAGAGFPFSGSAVITGSLLISGSGLVVTGSINAQSITGSLFGTSSWSQNSVSASFALTASYALIALTASFALNIDGGFY